MTNQWDFAVYNRHEQLVLVTEVKNKVDVAPEWAGRFRRNILVHGIYPDAPFFLMAFPDRFYLWTNSMEKQTQIDADYIVDARPMLQPYFEQAGVTPEQISGQSLELIVATWLSEILHTENVSEEWLTESGLYAAIAGGRFEHEVLV